MKKSLLALAVLSAFAGVASAQSSVTLYGRVDAGFTNFDPKAGNTTDVSATRGLSAGNLGGNRWGIRGSEDLGGGLKAVFTLESGFALDTGESSQGLPQLTRRQCQNTTTGAVTQPAAQTYWVAAEPCPTGTTEISNSVATSASARLFGRQAYLGLSGGFGSLVLGRIPSFSSGTGDFDKIGFLDPFRTGVGSLGWQATMSSMNSLRLDNAIAYVTPTLGGFSAGVGYSFAAIGGEKAGGSGANSNGYVSYINFASGPFYAVATYDDFKLGEIDPTATQPFLPRDPKQKHMQFGLSWDFKVVKLSAAYAIEEGQYALGPAGVTFNVFSAPSATATTTGAVQGAGSDADAWALGAVIPFGAHRINASYQSRSVDSYNRVNPTTGATSTIGEANRKAWALGYEYSFSRRTTLYAYYGDVADDDSYKSGNWGGVKQTFLGLSHTF